MKKYRNITEDQLDIVLHLGREGEAVEVIHQTVPYVSCQYIHHILTEEGIQPVLNRPETKNNSTVRDLDPEELDESWRGEEHRHRFMRKQSFCRSQGIPFEIEFEDIEWPLYCPVFGTPLDYFSGYRKHDNNPEFDKVIPELGYVKGNVRIISSRANRIKDNGTMEEHFQIAWYIQEHMKE